MNVLAVHCPGSETEGAGESAKVIVYYRQALRCFIITQEGHEEKVKLNPNTMTSLHHTEGYRQTYFGFVTLETILDAMANLLLSEDLEHVLADL